MLLGTSPSSGLSQELSKVGRGVPAEPAFGFSFGKRWLTRDGEPYRMLLGTSPSSGLSQELSKGRARRPCRACIGIFIWKAWLTRDGEPYRMLVHRPSLPERNAAAIPAGTV